MSGNRWNDYNAARNLKRPSPITNKDDKGDDDMRSPSPTNAMDVDPQSFSKYDEYIRGNPPEVITVETRIKSSNKGYELLQKQGWSEGQPLGLSGDGRVDPIPFQVKQDLTGLGKISQDVRMIETTVSQRRELDSERQRRETEYQRKTREDTVARQQALKSEISTTLAAFFCSLCSKQFQNVAQFDEHTNSYAHHHKARMKDMAANAKGVGLTGADAKVAEERQEKERKREEKELRRAAKAAGVKMPKSMVDASTSMATPVVLPPASEGTPGFKKPGWATVSSTLPPPAPSDSSQSVGGSKVDSSSDTRRTGSSGGWASISSSSGSAPPPPPPEPSSRSMASAPAFINAGWTSLDTGSSQAPIRSHPPAPSGLSSSFAQAPPPPPPAQTFAPPPPSSSSHHPPRTLPSQSNQWGSMPQPQQPSRSYSNTDPSQNYYGNNNDNVRYPSGPPRPPSPSPAPSSSHHPPRAPPSQSNQWGSTSQSHQPIQQLPSSYSNANLSQNYGNRNDNIRYPPGPPPPPSGPPPSRHPPPPGPSYNHPPLQGSSHNPRPGPGPGYQHPLPPAPQIQPPNHPPARSGWQQWNSSSGGPKRR